MNIKRVARNIFVWVVTTAVLLGGVVIFPLERLSKLAPDLYLAIKTFSKSLVRYKKNISRFISGRSKKLKPQPKSKKRKRKKIVLIEKETLNRCRKIVKKNAIPFSIGIMFAILVIFIPLQTYSWYRNLPQPELLSQLKNKSTKILDRKGRVLYEIYVDKDYDPVSLEEVPQVVIDATLAVEDAGFYSHNGIQVLSMIRAVKSILIDNELQGGSTITQQLVKNVLLSPERTVSRKLKEIVVALMVENTYSKGEILELYLNNIAYGGTSWGIQSASQKFFGKNVSDLTLAEAAFLAGLPSAPSTYSPFGRNEEFAKHRQNYVLQRMVELGYITKLDANRVYSEELAFVPQAQYIRAPHFVNFVRQMLEEEYGMRMVNFGGLTVTTTLDLELQEEIQEIVTSEVQINSHLNFSNGAAVVLDVRSGGLLAYVGSIDYFNDTIDGEYDVVTARRMPGSSIKPVTYSLALQKGYTPASVISDAPITISVPGSRPYSPRNYDGRFHGDVTLRQALANSYNIPAVKLVKNLGPDNMVALGKKMGLTNWEVDGSYGLSVTLGGKEVRLLDLSNVYTTLARGGKKIDPTPFLSIKDVNGFEIYRNGSKGSRSIPEEVAYLITNILSDNSARSAAFGPNSTLVIPGHTVAVKTGTTDEKRDNWTIGYTPSFVVGVWVGNNDNSPMHPYLSSGLSGASPIWNKAMKTLLDGYENEPFGMPSGVFVKVDPECDNKREVFIKGTAPEHLCDIGKKDEDDDKDKD